MHRLLCIFILSILTATVSAQTFDTVYEWNYIDYLWESVEQRAAAVSTGAYNLSRIIPTDVDRAPDGRVFMSFEGSRGVPARLAVVSDLVLPESGPIVHPYPSWDWHRYDAECAQRITSVYGLAVDRYNNRLWVLDSGMIAGSRGDDCPPQLLIFDLEDDELLERIEVPHHIAHNNTSVFLLANMVVRVSGENHDSTTVYIADMYGCGLIVMYPDGSFIRYEGFDPEYAQSTSGCDWGMAVSPVTYYGEPQYLYFRPFMSLDLYSVNTDYFDPAGYNIVGYVNSTGQPGILNGQVIGHAFASQGTLFMGMPSEMGITCWNRYRPMTPANVELVAEDEEELRYPNSLKVIPPSPKQDSEELWILSSQYYMGFQRRAFRDDDVNFRVLKSDVQSLISGTVCEEPIARLRSNII